MNNRIPIEELVESKEFRREISRTITLPTDLPDIDEIIDVGAQLDIIRSTARNGEVKLDGVLKWFISYRPADDFTRIITYQRTVDFDEVIPFEEARTGMEVDVDVISRRVSSQILGDRRISITFPVVYRIQVFRQDDIKYIVKEDGYTLITKPYKIQKGIIEEEEEVRIKRVKSLPEAIENSGDILSLESEIIVNTVETRRNVVIVKGEIITTIIYVTSNGRIVSRNLNSYFDERINISGVRDDMEAYVEGTILQEGSIFQGGDRLQLEYNVLFNILVITEEEIELPIEVIDTDLYPVEEYILVERSIREEKTKFLVSQETTTSRDVSNVIRGSAQIGEVEVNRLDDGIIIEGNGELTFLYASAEVDQPVYAARDEFSFDQFIDIPGLDENNRVYVEVRVDRISFELEDERTISSRIILEAKIIVTELVRIPVIVDVNGGEEQEEIDEGYRRYIVRSGDSLWLISRRFNTTVERIAQLNNINVNSQLQVGQQLLIPG
ncbi:DUF3794 and LysM peptidoglycan-binding domain-containing protein [Orenia marismortui]|uniref:DUF3794 and LysM peptidoglycan-binding domain-containing protein n=1 Tax=Orenia marismortui TaxID=46469 RepID=UPI0003698D1D|nr:SPOCS domain-containing protein [Orenia marismortui]